MNLRANEVEVRRDPDRGTFLYGTVRTALRGEQIALVAFPDASVAVSDLLPDR